MDMMTMMMFIMLMQGDLGGGSGDTIINEAPETNENDIWKALVLTLPDLFNLF